MLHSQTNIPVVMSFSMSDPTGGAGIQADIETLFSIGCHCAAVITTLTIQDTLSLKDYAATTTSLVIEQARVVLEDIPIKAFKIGMVGSVENLAAIHTLLTDYPDIPVVFNPRLLSQESKPGYFDEELIHAVNMLLCPLTTVLTVDAKTAQQLAFGSDTIEASIHKLMEQGCRYVVLKDCHSTAASIQNTFYGGHKLLDTFKWERIEGNFRGCGCILSASLAGFLAHGLSVPEAVTEAQKYTVACIKQGYRIGMGAYLPDRLFWAR
jgi:hydroxymethylpyrimidine/phosphomethylpyrimidine kinase